MDVTVFMSIALGLLGLTLGSFAGATVWRLRARQLASDARHGETVPASDKRRVAKLQRRSLSKDRSVCLHCGHVLAWYDLIPLISWATLRGRCRYCRKPIGYLEPFTELSLALFFVVSYLLWPSPLDSWIATTQFSIWLVAGFGLLILFVYDAKWFLLPDVVTFPLIGLGVINALIVIASAPSMAVALLNVVGSCLALSGLYYLIYVLSRHQWIGFGDVKLGLALGLLLADWQLSVLALFLANLIGTLLFLPFMIQGTVERHTHIPFGPLLIAGWAIAGIYGASILNWYTSITLGL